MRASSRSLVPSAVIVGLAAVSATAIILLISNIAIINAQQLINQTAVEVTQNETTTLFESAEDSFRVRLPEGWVIQDVNNTGVILAAEVLQGYGVLAELCPEEEEQGYGGGGQQSEQALVDVSGSKY